MVDVAALPDANANPYLPFSRSAIQSSNAFRVGLPDREYSYPVCTPGDFCANVDARLIGTVTAPVTTSAFWPACMHRVANDCSVPRVMARFDPA